MISKGSRCNSRPTAWAVAKIGRQGLIGNAIAPGYIVHGAEHTGIERGQFRFSLFGGSLFRHGRFGIGSSDLKFSTRSRRPVCTPIRPTMKTRPAIIRNFWRKSRATVEMRCRAGGRTSKRSCDLLHCCHCGKRLRQRTVTGGYDIGRALSILSPESPSKAGLRQEIRCCNPQHKFQFIDYIELSQNKGAKPKSIVLRSNNT